MILSAPPQIDYQPSKCILQESQGLKVWHDSSPTHCIFDFNLNINFDLGLNCVSTTLLRIPSPFRSPQILDRSITPCLIESSGKVDSSGSFAIAASRVETAPRLHRSLLMTSRFAKTTKLSPAMPAASCFHLPAHLWAHILTRLDDDFNVWVTCRQVPRMLRAEAEREFALKFTLEARSPLMLPFF